MTSYIACSRRASNAELVAILAEALKLEAQPTWCFVEGPTQCAFVKPAEVACHAVQLAVLWQVRLFAEDIEVAGRRRDFEDEQPWMVRWIAPEPPTGHGWSNLVNLPSGKSQNLFLYGQATAEGRFREGRFLRATLEYHGVAWNDGDQAVLIAETHELDDGAMVHWKGIAKYVPAVEVPDRAKS